MCRCSSFQWHCSWFIRQLSLLCLNFLGFNICQSSSSLVAFYHIFTEGNFHDIVAEQVRHIENSGLLSIIDNVFYATVGKGGQNFTINIEKFKFMRYHGEVGWETPTLKLLFDFCTNNIDDKVLYFHNKGSFHEHWNMNTNFRRMLNCYVLSPQCISVLDNHDTCGLRASPVPGIHYSGNFWWARCSYVNTLIDPSSYDTNVTFRTATDSFKIHAFFGLVKTDISLKTFHLLR